MTLISKRSPKSLNTRSIGRSVYIVLLFLFFLGCSIYFVLPQRALDSSGRRITGTVTNVYVGDKGRMYVEYSFQVGAQTYSGRCNVRTSDYRRDQVGGPVAVTYLPDRPEVSRIEPSNAALNAYLFFWAVLAGSGIAAIAVAGDAIRRRIG